MAVFRGHVIAPEPSQARLERLQRLSNELLASELPDKPNWQVFLDGAGGVELSALGEAVRQLSVARRAPITDLLIEFLCDPDWNRRDSAARILEAMGAQKAVLGLRQLLFQRAGESLARLAAIRALAHLGALMPDEIAMLRIDPSPLIREEADRLLTDLDKKKTPAEKSVALSNLLKKKEYPTSVFDNLIERDIILSLSRKGQPVRELADQIGRSRTTIRRYLALLQNKSVAQVPLQDREVPLVASRKKGKTVEYLLTKNGRKLTKYVGRAYSRFLKQKLASVTSEARSNNAVTSAAMPTRR
jgi:predicted transcriptional regulator